MKAGLHRSQQTLFALLLCVALGAACKSGANNANAGVTTTSTTTVNTSRSTTPAGSVTTPASRPAQEATPSSGARTPPDGSAERTAILDGVREHLKTKENFPKAVIEDVAYLKVKDGWAYISCFAGGPDGEPYGAIEAVMREQGGRWTVLEVLSYENSTEKADRAAFRDRHRDAPADIFPPA